MEAHRLPWQVATFMHDKGTTLYDEGKAQMLFFWRSFAFSYEEERRRRKEGKWKKRVGSSHEFYFVPELCVANWWRK